MKTTLILSALASASALSLARMEENPHEDPKHWDYSMERGPNKWGSLKYPDGSLVFPLCANGKQQSPVNLLPERFTPSKLPIERSYTTKKFQVVPRPAMHPGFNMVPLDGEAYMKVDGLRYDLLQFHAHAPSEHTINGKRLPLEIHFVHKNAETGGLAVYGILYNMTAIDMAAKDAGVNVGLPNRFIDSFIADAYHPAVIENVNLDGLIRDTSANYMRYPGSLTTPPCTEGVKWHVTTATTGVNDFELMAFSFALGQVKNSRPVLPFGNTRGVKSLKNQA